LDAAFTLIIYEIEESEGCMVKGDKRRTMVQSRAMFAACYSRRGEKRMLG
jgi:hypothetical protein